MPRFKIDRQFGPITWAGLSSLRTVSFLKIGYIGAIGIPLAAFVLRQTQLLGVDVQIPLTLFWMYLGSMLLALGHLFNEIACPYAIKKFQALHEFRTQTAESFAVQALIRHARQINLTDSVRTTLGRDGRMPVEDQEALAEEIARTVFDMGGGDEEPPEQTKGVAATAVVSPDPETLWTQANESLYALRCVIVALYGTSALIVGFFSVRQFWIVLMATFGSPAGVGSG